MPYVSQETRDRWASLIDLLEHSALTNGRALGAGEVNYLVTKILLAWLGSRPRYNDYNAAIGVLECIKLELYSRRVRPYEDEKRMANGDVY